MSVFRYGLIGIGLIGIAALFGSQIKALEAIKQDGEVVLLDLRPVDPRALMMGDFMALRYAEEQPGDLPDDMPAKGAFVLKKDANNVGTFVRVDDGKNLGANEIKINFTRKRWGVNFGAPRYYFQNGTAKTYEDADYGMFKINPEGRAILVGLAGEDFKQIKPPVN